MQMDKDCHFLFVRLLGVISGMKGESGGALVWVYLGRSEGEVEAG